MQLFFLGRYAHNFEIAVESIRENKLKSFLTALGIIFGAAAVISMLAIGSGAQREILEQMKQVGVNNIVITALDPSTEESSTDDSKTALRRFSPGLNERDLACIRGELKTLRYLVPVVQYDGQLQSNWGNMQGEVIGTNEDYFSLYNLKQSAGTLFLNAQAQKGAQVCVVGEEVAHKLFRGISPVGQRIKYAGLWFAVIGVLEGLSAASDSKSGLGPVGSSSAIFVPIQTLKSRYQSRLLRPDQQADDTEEAGNKLSARLRAHQIDRIILQVRETGALIATADVLERMFVRLHSGVADYRIVIPEQLLKQQQRTNAIFNWVLGAIAAISLLVGGIGIMNIMFASVMERIKEIGTRLAIGAKASDIVAQFLLEAVLISLSGGLLGIILGIVLSLVISHVAGIETVVSVYSVVVSFGVSVTVGLIFGLAPARRAAKRSPIESLRYE